MVIYMVMGGYHSRQGSLWFMKYLSPEGKGCLFPVYSYILHSDWSLTYKVVYTVNKVAYRKHQKFLYVVYDYNFLMWVYTVKLG